MYNKIYSGRGLNDEENASGDARERAKLILG